MIDLRSKMMLFCCSVHAWHGVLDKKRLDSRLSISKAYIRPPRHQSRWTCLLDTRKDNVKLIATMFWLDVAARGLVHP